MPFTNILISLQFMYSHTEQYFQTVWKLAQGKLIFNKACETDSKGRKIVLPKETHKLYFVLTQDFPMKHFFLAPLKLHSTFWRAFQILLSSSTSGHLTVGIPQAPPMQHVQT